MKFDKFKKIKDNFQCYLCGYSGYYSNEYIKNNIYCEQCQDKKSLLGKFIEWLIK